MGKGRGLRVNEVVEAQSGPVKLTGLKNQNTAASGIIFRTLVTVCSELGHLVHAASPTPEIGIFGCFGQSRVRRRASARNRLPPIVLSVGAPCFIAEMTLDDIRCCDVA